MHLSCMHLISSARHEVVCTKTTDEHQQAPSRPTTANGKVSTNTKPTNLAGVGEVGVSRGTAGGDRRPLISDYARNSTRLAFSKTTWLGIWSPRVPLTIMPAQEGEPTRGAASNNSSAVGTRVLRHSRGRLGEKLWVKPGEHERERVRLSAILESLSHVHGEPLFKHAIYLDSTPWATRITPRGAPGWGGLCLSSWRRLRIKLSGVVLA